MDRRDAPTIPQDLGIVHKIVDIEDDPLTDLLSLLDEICTWIDAGLTPSLQSSDVEQSTNSPNVLVHCRQGISRSGSVVVAQIMRQTKVDYDTALARARTYRDIITPNEGFESQLRLWGEMGCSIRRDNGELKHQYVAWKAEKDRTVAAGEEEKNRVRAKSMASMAAEFGARRLKKVEEAEQSERGT